MGGDDGAKQDLMFIRQCYLDALNVAYDLKVKSVAISDTCGSPAL